MEKMTSLLRLRMSAKDAHYGGNLVDGAHMVHLFGDVATELLIKCDGDEGLLMMILRCRGYREERYDCRYIDKI